MILLVTRLVRLTESFARSSNRKFRWQMFSRAVGIYRLGVSRHPSLWDILNPRQQLSGEQSLGILWDWGVRQPQTYP